MKSFFYATIAKDAKASLAKSKIQIGRIRFRFSQYNVFDLVDHRIIVQERMC